MKGMLRDGGPRMNENRQKAGKKQNSTNHNNVPALEEFRRRRVDVARARIAAHAGDQHHQALLRKTMMITRARAVMVFF
jgi:hypothetical protein